MLFGMIKESALQYSDEEIDRFAAALTEAQIQFIVDLYTGYANVYNAKAYQFEQDHADEMAKWAHETSDAWMEEAGQWAMRPAGLNDDGTEIA